MGNILGNRIKALRNEAELTQEEFGDKLNVTKVAVSKWELGKRSPDTEMLIKIADIGNVSTDWLLGRTDIPKAKLYKYVFDGEEIEIAVNKDKIPDENYVKDLYEKIKLVDRLESMGFKFPSEKKE